MEGTRVQPVPKNSYPIVVQEPDGTWSTWYPEQGYIYKGTTREDAVSQLPARQVLRGPPKTEQLSSGVWRASFPEFELEANGATESEAVENLRALDRSCYSEPWWNTRLMELLNDPPDTWTVNFVPQEDAWTADIENLKRNPNSIIVQHGQMTPKGWVPDEDASRRSD